MQEHLENAPSLRELIEERATIHQIIWSDEYAFAIDYSHGDDQAVMVTGRLSGTKPSFIIIDEVQPLLSEELYDFVRELGVKEKKPARPTKQPDWARHNQAPRSARRRR